jgi:hypothetical protein
LIRNEAARQRRVSTGRKVTYLPPGDRAPVLELSELLARLADRIFAARATFPSA